MLRRRRDVHPGRAGVFTRSAGAETGGVAGRGTRRRRHGQSRLRDADRCRPAGCRPDLPRRASRRAARRVVPPRRVLRVTSARRLTAPDGVEIALHRMRAHRDGRPAVLLVHGAFSGHTVWLRNGRARDAGLAHFLGARGYDVWLADLRGHGASAREPKRFHWRFEDWILKDTPALV